jgi:hypothetical protein
LSGVRWTTGLGIAVGGVGGAVVALLGAATSTRVPASVVAAAPVRAPNITTPVAASVPEPVVSAAPEAVAAPPIAASVAAAEASASPASTAPPSATFGSAPALERPTTLEALLRAELYCDKRQDFDECGRAAAALEAGSAGPPDAKQAKRFRRIALTHLVAQCEADSPHACFVIAAKYRAGAELTASPVRAEALEKRGLELCRLGRRAPECPPS